MKKFIFAALLSLLSLSAQAQGINNSKLGTVTSVTCNGVAITTSGTCSTIGQIPGGASAASAGNIGEVLKNTVGLKDLSSNTQTNVGTITLTTGNWVVSGMCWYGGDAITTVTYQSCGISPTSATLPAAGTTARNSATAFAATPFAADNINLFAGPVIVNGVSGNTPYYMVCFETFATSTATCGGQITAWRLN